MFSKNQVNREYRYDIPIIDIKSILLNKVCGFSGIAEHEHSDKVLDWENGGSLGPNSKGNIEDFQCLASHLNQQRKIELKKLKCNE